MRQCIKTMTKFTRIHPNKKHYKREPTRQEFIRFTAFPELLRGKEFGFDTDKDFAKANRVNTDTLCEWKKDYEFWDEVKGMWIRWGKHRTPNVIMGLYRNAVNKGNAAEAIAWMKIFEDFKEKSDTTLVLTRQTLKNIQDGIRAVVERNKNPKN